jgi:hypothetical protein
MSTTARPYMSVSVHIDTPDAPLLNGKTVQSVSWSASLSPWSGLEYTINAHHPYRSDDGGTLDDRLTPVLRTKRVDPAIVPDWVPWPPAGWLASLELDAPAGIFTPSPELVAGGFIPDPAEWVHVHVPAAHAATFRGACS